MRDAFIKYGEILPTKMPSGPNNPLGNYALYLGNNYAIHGIQHRINPGIGLRTTWGCIRLRSQDIKYLYDFVPVGTKVQFINDPIKTTIDSNGMRYLEVHHPLSIKNNNQIKNTLILTNLKKQTYSMLKNVPNIDWSIVNQALQHRSGIPVNITKLSK